MPLQVSIRVESHFVVYEDTETIRAKIIKGLYLMMQLLLFGYINIAFEPVALSKQSFCLKIITWLLCVNTNKPKPKAVT